ncbi:MAG TPA: signal peptidase II [Gemmataceae bacterium]|nr:signal peptidase II [Gemmataceae bacterium]
MEMALTAGLVVVVDQLAKALVVRRLALGESVRIGRFLTIRHALNANSEHRFVSSRLVLLLQCISALTIVLLVIQVGYFFQGPAAQTGLGAAFGGSAGNLVDRFRRNGAVLDFVDFGWWPAFNLADVAIALGAVIALLFFR